MEIHEVSFELFTIAHNFYELNSTLEKANLRIEYCFSALSLSTSLYKSQLILCCGSNPAGKIHNICFTAKSITDSSDRKEVEDFMRNYYESQIYNEVDEFNIGAVTTRSLAFQEMEREPVRPTFRAKYIKGSGGYFTIITMSDLAPIPPPASLPLNQLMLKELKDRQPRRYLPLPPILPTRRQFFSGYEFSNEPFPEMLSAELKEACKQTPARELTHVSEESTSKSKQSSELTVEKKEKAKASRKRKQPRMQKPKRELTDVEFNEELRRAHEQDVSEESTAKKVKTESN